VRWQCCITTCCGRKKEKTKKMKENKKTKKMKENKKTKKKQKQPHA
jgi:hypothetical protein